jgi:hypothetical protein
MTLNCSDTFECLKKRHECYLVPEYRRERKLKT